MIFETHWARIYENILCSLVWDFPRECHFVESSRVVGTSTSVSLWQDCAHQPDDSKQLVAVAPAAKCPVIKCSKKLSYKSYQMMSWWRLWGWWRGHVVWAKSWGSNEMWHSICWWVAVQLLRANATNEKILLKFTFPFQDILVSIQKRRKFHIKINNLTCCRMPHTTDDVN